MSKKSYCVQNYGDCQTCSLSSYGRDCRNEIIFNGVRQIEFKEWLEYWLLENSEPCQGCNADIYFKDTAFEHSSHDGLFCAACAEKFNSGSLPPLL